MNRIYLIGNGFDCAHDLKTRYSDFLFWYLKESISKAYSSGKPYRDAVLKVTVPQFSQLDMEQISSWSDIKDNLNLPKYHTTPLINAMFPGSESEFLIGSDRSQPKFEIEIKSEFAKTVIINCINAGWVDIEKEFYLALKMSANIDGKTHLRSVEKIDDLNCIFETIIKKLPKYFETIDTKAVSQNVLRLFDLNSIEDGEVCKPRKYLVICFNYTNTVEKYIRKEPFDKGIGLEYELVFIHGQVADPDNPIIFGYGDETDKHFALLEDLDDSRYTKYFKSNGYGLTPNYRIISDFIDKVEFDVHVLGHSCGSSDKVLLKAIFDNKNCREIKILHYEKPDGTNDYIDIYQNIGRCFSTNNRHAFRCKTVNYNRSNCMPQIK